MCESTDRLCKRSRHSISACQPTKVRLTLRQSDSGSSRIDETSAISPPRVLAIPDRHTTTSLSFGKNQPWVKTHSDLRFLNETKDIVSFYNSETPNDKLVGIPTPSEKAIGRPNQEQNKHVDAAATPYQAFDPLDTAGYSDIDGRLGKRRRLSEAYTPSQPSYSTDPVVESKRSPVISTHQLHVSGWTPISHGSQTKERSAYTDVESITPHDRHSTYFPPSSALAQEQILSPGDPSSFHALRISDFGPHVNSTDNAISPDSLSSLYLEAPIWPLSSREEAELLQYYVDHIARYVYPVRHSYPTFPDCYLSRTPSSPFQTCLGILITSSNFHLSLWVICPGC